MITVLEGLTSFRAPPNRSGIDLSNIGSAWRSLSWGRTICLQGPQNREETDRTFWTGDLFIRTSLVHCRWNHQHDWVLCPNARRKGGRLPTVCAKWVRTKLDTTANKHLLFLFLGQTRLRFDGRGSQWKSLLILHGYQRQLWKSISSTWFVGQPSWEIRNKVHIFLETGSMASVLANSEFRQHEVLPNLRCMWADEEHPEPTKHKKWSHICVKVGVSYNFSVHQQREEIL